MIRVLLAAGAAVGLAGFTQVTPPRDPLAAVGITTATPGCGVGVTRQGERLLREDAGLADMEHGAPITSDTVFEAGSASKQFTAAAVLMLAEEGRLTLSDSVRTYLPELPAYADAITIADLLGHTSGLRDWRWIRGVAGWGPGTAVHTNGDVLTIASRQLGLNHPPGEAYSYTNTGYNLLAIIVERVTGRSLADYSDERIFRRLGMTKTRWRNNFRDIVLNRAIAYRREAGSTFVHDMPFENAYGAGGLLTTVDDLLIWNEALDSGALGAAVTSALQEPGRLSDGQPTGHAKGLMLRRYRGVEEVGHGGVTGGYVSYVARYPAQHVSVVVLCNSSGLNPRRLAETLVDPILTDLDNSRNEPSPTVAEPAGARPLWRPTPGELAAVSGLYRSREVGADYRIDYAGGQLRLAIDDIPEETWTANPTYADTLVFSLGSISLERNDGAVTGFVMDVERAKGLRFIRIGD